MTIHYNIWKRVRRCTLIFTVLISKPYVAQMEDFAREEERWSQAWTL